MAKTAVIYWSGTGNTEAMASAVAEGINAAGGAAELMNVSETSADAAAGYEKLALGCPAMGSEVLEESEFEPFFTDLEANISGKKIALFGSYGWGDGEWMRSWAECVTSGGATVVGGEGLIVNDAPDDDALDSCKQLGAALVSA